MPVPKISLPKQLNHWKPVSPATFTSAQRPHTTLLFGGLTPAHEKLIQGGLSALGYHSAIIPTPTQYDFQTGKELCNYGLCNPGYFTGGALVNYLLDLENTGLSKAEIIQRYAYLTATSPCGPCRFGLYQNELQLALEYSGYKGFRVLTIEQKPSLWGDTRLGLNVNSEFSLTLLYALLIGDLLNQMAYTIRPYETEPGETNRVLMKSVDYMSSTLATINAFSHDTSAHDTAAKRKTTNKASSKYFSRVKLLSQWFNFFAGQNRKHILTALHQVGHWFNDIEIDPLRLKPVVKITGEFWAQTTEGDGNFKLFEFLESEGAAIHNEPVATWLDYLIHMERLKNKDQTQLIDKDEIRITPMDKIKAWMRYKKKQIALELIQYQHASLYNAMRRALYNLPSPLINQQQLESLGHGYYHSRARGGEGHMEVAKNLYYHLNHLAHMTLSLKPFGCMPSTQSDGVQIAVQATYKNMIFIPIETGGEAKTSALSRVQMALSDAKVKANNEWRTTLQECGLSIETVQRVIQQHPQLIRPATCLTLHHGAASVAANLAYHIKQILPSLTR